MQNISLQSHLHGDNQVETPQVLFAWPLSDTNLDIMLTQYLDICDKKHFFRVLNMYID